MTENFQESIENDTIAAISTGMVTAGISVIRVSGPEAVDVADRVFSCGEKKIKEQQTHTIHHGKICDKSGAMIDEVLVMLMRAPHTYTGEDTVEINCHGGLYVTTRVLDEVVQAGARLAHPGEFTKRAFLNGKMDLSRAEAVAELIEADNERARKAAAGQLAGKEEVLIRKYQEDILLIMAFAEAALDDPEHLSVDDEIDHIKAQLTDMLKALHDLHRTAGQGKLIKEGIRTVICGKPNAGKSSLLNRLLGENRSIVSNIAGTTRDTISEKVNLGTFTLNVIDTAGITQTDDPIEAIGVERAEDEIEKAQLVLYVADGSTPLDENDRQIARQIAGKNVICLINKMDLKQAFEEKDLLELLDEEKKTEDRVIAAISAKSGEGINELKKEIEKMFFGTDISGQDEVILLGKRHEYALAEAVTALEQTITGINQKISEEFWLVDLKDTYDRLGEITGDTVGENLIDEIFSKFCMGK